MRVGDMMPWSDWGHQYGAPLQQLCTLLPSLTILLGLLWFSEPNPFFIWLKFHLSEAFSNCKEKSDYYSLLWAPVALTVYRAQAAQSTHHLPSESGLSRLGIHAAHHILESSRVCSACFIQWYWPRPTLGMAFLPRKVYYYLCRSRIWDVSVFWHLASSLAKGGTPIVEQIKVF